MYLPMFHIQEEIGLLFDARMEIRQCHVREQPPILAYQETQWNKFWTHQARNFEDIKIKKSVKHTTCRAEFVCDRVAPPSQSVTGFWYEYRNKYIKR